MACCLSFFARFLRNVSVYFLRLVLFLVCFCWFLSFLFRVIWIYAPAPIGVLCNQFVWVQNIRQINMECKVSLILNGIFNRSRPCLWAQNRVFIWLYSSSVTLKLWTFVLIAEKQRHFPCISSFGWCGKNSVAQPSQCRTIIVPHNFGGV